MGFSLKKFVRGAVKIGKKIAPQLLKATPVGALAVRAQQAAKALGVNFKAARAKPQPLSVQSAIARPALSIASSRPQVKRRLSGLVKSARKAKVSTGKGRTPPKGGLDLKRIAALWRSQGKPGTWIEFIKANPIRK